MSVRLKHEKINRCKFYCIRKHRCCSMYPVEGFDFCAQHCPQEEDESDICRVPCPLDPKHTVKKYKLAEHLRICTARHEKSRPVIVDRISRNQFDNVTDHNNRWKRMLSMLKEYCVDETPCTDEQFSSYEKNITQCKALADLIYQKLYKPQQIYHFIEVGAGKMAGLSLATSELFPDAHFLLIDRQAFKSKRDSLIKLNNPGSIQRLRKDLNSIEIQELLPVDSSEPCVLMAKHLCGSATDVLLSKFIQAANQNNLLKAVVVSFCCYNRCSLLDEFIGKDYLRKHSLDQGDFQLLCHVSNWHTTFLKAKISNDIPKSDVSEEFLRMQIGNLTDYQRKLVGSAAKRLLDKARASSLELTGRFNVELLEYVNKECTPQNVALIAIVQDI